MPIDADEVNGAMERYIRQKYELKSFSSDAPPAPRHNTGATSTSTSSDDHPPALPPKPRKSFFGLRSTSSILPSRHERMSPPVSPGSFGNDTSPPRMNKASRVFGSTIGSSSSESFDAKLVQLREMGFTDERRNSTVLKGLNGNLDKTVEALIRLGGDGSRSPVRTESPAVPPKDDHYKTGISLQKTRQSATNTPLTQTPQAINSTNPFDALDAPQVQQQPQHANSLPGPAATGFFQQNRSFTTPNPYNPFMSQPQPSQMPQQQSLDQSFQALTIAAPQQPQQLFPNATGGYANPSQPQNNPFLQTYTPPPVSTYQSQAFPSLNTQLQPNGLSQQPQQQNPFLRQTRSQNFTPSSNPNPFGLSPTELQQSTPFSTAPQASQQQSNPFGIPSPPSQQQQPYTFPLDQQPFAQMQNQQPQVQPQQQPLQQFNPFLQSQASQQQIFPDQAQQQYQHQQSQQPYQQFQSQQPQQQSMPFRHDKSSILALYNMPQLAPQMPPPTSTSDPNSPVDNSGSAQFQSLPFPKRSATMPVSSGPAAGSHNPFATSTLAPVAENSEVAASPAAHSFATYGTAPMASAGNAGGANAFTPGPATGLGAGSRESVDFMNLSMSGRHSPDAFAGLSARPFVR